MVKEYSKSDFQRELENNGPRNIFGFHRLDLKSLGINPDFQDLRTAASNIPEVLQNQVWELAYGQIKYGVESGNSIFGIAILPILSGRRPNEAEIEEDSYSFGSEQAQHGPNRVIETTYKFFGFEKPKEELSLKEIRENLSSITYKGPSEITAELPMGINFINSNGELERLLVQSKDSKLGDFHLDGKLAKVNGEYGILYGPNDFESVQRYLLD